MSKRLTLKCANRANMAEAARRQMALINKCRVKKQNREPDWRPFDREW